MKQAIAAKHGDLHDPYLRKTIPNGTMVETTDPYWARALRDGDVVIYKPPAPVEKPDEKPVSINTENKGNS